MKNEKKKNLTAFAVIGVGAVGLIALCFFHFRGGSDNVGVDEESTPMAVVTLIDIDGNETEEYIDPDDPDNIVNSYKDWEDDRVRMESVSDGDAEVVTYEVADGVVLKSKNISEDYISYGNDMYVPYPTEVYHVIDENQMYHCKNGEITVNLSVNDKHKQLDSFTIKVKDGLTAQDIINQVKGKGITTELVDNAGYVTLNQEVTVEGASNGILGDKYMSSLPLFLEDAGQKDEYSYNYNTNCYWSYLTIYPSSWDYIENTEDYKSKRYYKDIDEDYVYEERYYLGIDDMIEAFGQPYAVTFNWVNGTEYLWLTDSNMYFSFVEQPNTFEDHTNELTNVLLVHSTNHGSRIDTSTVYSIYTNESRKGTDDYVEPWYLVQ